MTYSMDISGSGIKKRRTIRAAFNLFPGTEFRVTSLGSENQTWPSRSNEGKSASKN